MHARARGTQPELDEQDGGTGGGEREGGTRRAGSTPLASAKDRSVCLAWESTRLHHFGSAHSR
eukprot:1403242-Rhodomonas_salina.2